MTSNSLVVIQRVVVIVLLSSLASGELLLELVLYFVHEVVLLNLSILSLRLFCDALWIDYLVDLVDTVLLSIFIVIRLFTVADLNDSQSLEPFSKLEADIS